MLWCQAHIQRHPSNRQKRVKSRLTVKSWQMDRVGVGVLALVELEPPFRPSAPSELLIAGEHINVLYRWDSPAPSYYTSSQNKSPLYFIWQFSSKVCLLKICQLYLKLIVIHDMLINFIASLVEWHSMQIILNVVFFFPGRKSFLHIFSCIHFYFILNIYFHSIHGCTDVHHVSKKAQISKHICLVCLSLHETVKGVD